MVAWTDERIEDLKTLWSDGLSCSQIANALGGITRNAVIGKAHRLGLPDRAREARWPVDEEAKDRFQIFGPGPRRQRRRREPKKSLHRYLKISGAVIHEPTPIAPIIPMLEDQNIPHDQRKTLLELTESTCRWPVGDPGAPDFFFCGGEAASELPYCPHHSRIAYAGRPTPNARPYFTRTGAKSA